MCIDCPVDCPVSERRLFTRLAVSRCRLPHRRGLPACRRRLRGCRRLLRPGGAAVGECAALRRQCRLAAAGQRRPRLHVVRRRPARCLRLCALWPGVRCRLPLHLPLLDRPRGDGGGGGGQHGPSPQLARPPPPPCEQRLVTPSRRGQAPPFCTSPPTSCAPPPPSSSPCSSSPTPPSPPTCLTARPPSSSPRPSSPEPPPGCGSGPCR